MKGMTDEMSENTYIYGQAIFKCKNEKEANFYADLLNLFYFKIGVTIYHDNTVFDNSFKIKNVDKNTEEPLTKYELILQVYEKVLDLKNVFSDENVFEGVFFSVKDIKNSNEKYLYMNCNVAMTG